jgi:FkbM family methyltransferase
VSYAQLGEDVRLARILWDRAPGFYVDVGAGDPLQNSVTRLFYDAGWHGINIEPGPAYHRLTLARPRDVNLRVAVAVSEGERDFWVCRPNTELSSLDRPDGSMLPEGSRLERERIPCRRLDGILAEHGEPAIDFLKIDVEGAEPDVLASVDLRRFRPAVLVVEAIDPRTHRPSHAPWEPGVLASGYELVVFDGVNRFYLAEEHAGLRGALGYPLTPLDNYVTAGSLRELGQVAGGTESPTFPSLAEELAREVPSNTRAAESLTVILDGVDDQRRVASVLDAPAVLLAVGSEGRGSAGDTAPARRLASGLERVRAAIAREPHDVLVVSDTTLLTRSSLVELRDTLAYDSACATVSATERTSGRLDGIPGPTVAAPVRGVVLVRRDHLLLALDEVRLLASPGVGLVHRVAGDDLVGDVLASLVRPGFIHRLSGRDDSPETPPAAAPRPRRGDRAPAVVIDARCLRDPMSGTQVYVLGLLGGLVRTGTRVTALVPRDIHPSVEPSLANLRPAMPFVERVGPARPTVFHRPSQIGAMKVLADCLCKGDRLVLTHLDMIVDRTPGYLAGSSAWERYRQTTRAALSSADQLGFLSHHTARDAASDGVFELERATVIHLGVDHLRPHDDERRASPLAGRPYVLVMGNAFWHKNRLFALRLLRWLVEGHGWDGGLVLAGGHPQPGSSRPVEEVFLREAPSLAGRVADVGHVPDTERNALYRGASLVLFPSLYEGFGFVPFEAAAFGVPCAYALRASMGELLPSEGALPSFDLEQAGPFVLNLLERPEARERVVAAIADVASDLTWERTAAGYAEVYERAADRLPHGASRDLLGGHVASWGMSENEARLLDIYRRRRVFRVGVEGAIRVGARALRLTGRKA